MAFYFCFGCHNNLTYISHRRLMCYSCEKIYGEDYACRPCSGKKRTKIFMEVVSPGKARCILCGNENDAPGMNLETSMTRESLTRIKGRIGSSERGGLGMRAPRTQGGDFLPTVRPRASRAKSEVSQRIPRFPSREDPDILEDENIFTVIAEFPRHKSINDIAWRIEGPMLFIESKLEDCPYRDEIKLPDWSGESPEINFQNGILEIVFNKQAA